MRIALDCGGSFIRVGTQVVRGQYPSAYKIIRQDYIPPEVDSEEIAEISSPNHNITIVKGRSANYFGSSIKEQRNDTTKTGSEETLINISYGIARFLLDNYDIGPDKTYKIEVLLALPPREAYSELRDKMKSLLTGEYSIVFGNKETVKFNITEVRIMAEGLAALAAIEQDFSGLNIMVVDAGYRSTEVCIVKDYTPVNGALETYPLGGINLEADLEKILSKNGLQLGIQEIRECLADGVTQRKIKVGPLVKIIKKEFSEELYRIMNSVANMAGVPLSSIQVLVLTGRVFNETGYKDDEKVYGDSIENMLKSKVNATVFAGYNNIDGLCSSL